MLPYIILTIHSPRGDRAATDVTARTTTVSGSASQKLSVRAKNTPNMIAVYNSKYMIVVMFFARKRHYKVNHKNVLVSVCVL